MQEVMLRNLSNVPAVFLLHKVEQCNYSLLSQKMISQSIPLDMVRQRRRTNAELLLQILTMLKRHACSGRQTQESTTGRERWCHPAEVNIPKLLTPVARATPSATLAHAQSRQPSIEIV